MIASLIKVFRARNSSTYDNVVSLLEDSADASTPMNQKGTGGAALIGARTDVISQTPVITAGAYSANDAVGGLLTFANSTAVAGHTGVIQSVTIIDEAKQSADLELALFDTTFTPTADNAAFAPSDTVILTCIAVIPITTYYDFSVNSVGVAVNLGIAFKTSGSANLFGQLLTRGTPTYAATNDLTIKLGILQD